MDTKVDYSPLGFLGGLHGRASRRVIGTAVQLHRQRSSNSGKQDWIQPEAELVLLCLHTTRSPRLQAG